MVAFHILPFAQETSISRYGGFWWNIDIWQSNREDAFEGECGQQPEQSQHVFASGILDLPYVVVQLRSCMWLASESEHQNRLL